MEVLRLPKIVLIQWKHDRSVLFRFLPTTWGWGWQPTSVPAEKQARPSETTVAEGAKCCSAQFLTSA